MLQASPLFSAEVLQTQDFQYYAVKTMNVGTAFPTIIVGTSVPTMVMGTYTISFGGCSNKFCWNSYSNNYFGNNCSNNYCGNMKFLLVVVPTTFVGTFVSTRLAGTLTIVAFWYVFQ